MFYHSPKSKELTLDNSIYITKLKPAVVRSLVESFVNGDPRFVGSFTTGRLASQFQIHGFNQSGMIVLNQCKMNNLDLVMIDYRLGDKELVQYLVHRLGTAVVEHKGTESKQDVMDFCESAAKFFERLQQRVPNDPKCLVTESAIESARECCFQDFEQLSQAIFETHGTWLEIMHCPRTGPRFRVAFERYRAKSAYVKTILYKDQKVVLDQIIQVTSGDGELVLSVHCKWDLEECRLVIGLVTEHFNFDF
jgi:hypothetical protein